MATEALLRQGYTVIVVLNTRYHDIWADEIHQLESIENVFVPPPIPDSKSDDRVMVKYATNKGCKILSNDKFRDHLNTLSKEKRSSAKVWINSEVLQFHFNEKGFELGLEQGGFPPSPINVSDLADWMVNRINTNHQYNLMNMVRFFLEYYDQSRLKLPTRKEFCQALKIRSDARFDRIVKALLAPTFVGFGQYDGKIDFSLKFQERHKLSLNSGVVDECVRQLKGILHSNWVDGLSLSHQLNVGLGNTLGRRVNSDTLKRHLGLPKTTAFRDILLVCLGDQILEFELKRQGQYQQWYGLISDEVPKLPVEIKLKHLLKEVKEENYSVLNIPISPLVPEIDKLVAMENLWRVGMGKSEIAKLVLEELGNSVKTLFGSLSNMLCVVNQWYHGWEHWYFDSNGNLRENIDCDLI